jgi:hypothetical protein
MDPPANSQIVKWIHFYPTPNYIALYVDLPQNQNVYITLRHVDNMQKFKSRKNVEFFMYHLKSSGLKAD